MAYDYIKEVYGLEFRVGQRVRHIVNRKAGSVLRRPKGNSRYVRVAFDRCSIVGYCHPQEVIVLSEPATADGPVERYRDGKAET